MYVLHMASISHQNKLDSAIILVCIVNEKIANKFQQIEYTKCNDISPGISSICLFVGKLKR